MVDSEIFHRIDQILDGYVLEGESKPYFAKVFRGIPEGLIPVDRLCCYWYLGWGAPPEGIMTFTNIMRMHRIRVKSLWMPSPVPEIREKHELEIFSVSHELPGDFLADVGLNATVERCLLEDCVVDSEQFPPGSDSPVWRTLQFDLQLVVLEGETISR